MNCRAIVCAGLTFLLLMWTQASSRGQPPTPVEQRPAFLEVKLPADARLEIQNHKTQSTGARRRFQSPPLTPGKEFTYKIKATWKENGKDIVRDETVKVRAGQTARVDLLQPATTTPRPVTPAPSTTPPGAPQPPASSAAPEPGFPATLRLSLPAIVELKPGLSRTIEVKVTRLGFQGAVDMRWEGLPDRVSARPVTLGATEGTAKVEFTAAADAGDAEKEVRLLASGGNVKAEAKTKVRVRKATLAPPPPS